MFNVNDLPSRPTLGQVAYFGGFKIMYLETGWQILDYTDSPSGSLDTREAEYGALRTFIARDQPKRNDNVEIITLMNGADGEVPTVSVGTYSVDTTNFKVGDRGHKLTMAGAGLGQLYLYPVGPNNPVSMDYASSVCAWVHVTTPANITSINIDLFQTDLGTPWSRGSTSIVGFTLQAGWNLLRFAGQESTNAGWNIYMARMLVDATGACAVTLGHMWVEKRPKASIVFINDSCYKTFKDYCAAEFRANNWPITWAVDALIMGLYTGTPSERLTTAALIETLEESGIDSCSFHGYAGDVSLTKTAAQIRSETTLAQKWISQNIPGPAALGRFWRAAWMQNTANNGAAQNPYVWASGTYTGLGGTFTMPCATSARYNIPRTSIHGVPTSTLDTFFDIMLENRSAMLMYTHGVHEDSVGDVTPTVMDYVMNFFRNNSDKVELVTMETLFERQGGKFIHSSAGLRAEWLDENGTARNLLLT